MIEIYADFDHDGRIQLRPAEHDLRQRLPGALVKPNNDADGRALPATVGALGNQPLIDSERSTKSSQDNDLMPFTLRLTQPLPAQATVVVDLPADVGTRVRLYDARNRILTPQTTPTAKRYPLPPFSGTTMNLGLEVTSFGGVAIQSNATTPSSSPLMLTLTARVIDASGAVLGSDTAMVSVAPLILVGDNAPAERLYMAEVSQNTPSLRDMQAAIRSTGVPLVVVPESVSNGDTWLQDQFQLGYTHTPEGAMRTIFHLPRLRSNSAPTMPLNNLVGFVNEHFPSTNLGVFREFWNRIVVINDVNGQTVTLPFVDSDRINQLINRFFSVRSVLLHLLEQFDRPTFNVEKINGTLHSFFWLRADLRSLLTKTNQSLDRAIAATSEPTAQQFLRSLKTDAGQRVTQIERDLPFHSNGAQSSVTLSSGQTTVEVDETEFDRLSDELFELHTSLNYGGNLEVSPPMPGLVYGKLVVGSLSFENRRHVDPDIIAFLNDQRVQPLVTINTSWLDVGHVDELLTFAPSTYGRGGFAILRASPGTALAILRSARALYLSGLSPFHQNQSYRFSAILSRNTNDGTHPVTHLFRGKAWLHHHPTGSDAPLEPPRIYQRLATANNGSMVSVHSIPFTPGQGPDRYYKANISILEFSFFENATNHCIETCLLAERPVSPDAISGADPAAGAEPTPLPAPPNLDEQFDDCLLGDNLPADRKREFRQFIDQNRLDTILKREFPDTVILPLPVLFDRLDDWLGEQTLAFTPDLVNLQLIGNEVFIPRPYGPRMTVDDAVTVLREVMGAMDAQFSRNLNARSLIQRQLHRTTHWADGGADSTAEITLNEVASLFADGFSHGQAVSEAIDRANPGLFRNGTLRRGWHKLIIPENKVDLFEAYTQLVLETIGLRVHWVDSWYYHVRAGGIHCGTNVIRRVNVTRTNRWWDNQLPAQSFDFESEPVIIEQE